MPRYKTELNDVTRDALDVAWAGFNDYMRPDQLPSGMLSKSVNGRIDGSWQVRPGIDVVSAPLAAGALALTLPFYIYAPATATVAARAGDTITLTFASPPVFVNGQLVGISGITGLTPDPNGNRVLTSVTATQVTFDVTGLSGTIAGTVVVGSPYIDNDSVESVYGSCGYSDPNESGSNYIIIASNIKGILINLNDQTTTDIAYPTDIFISQAVDLLQFNNKVFIFRNGKVALEWDGDLTGTPAFTEVQNGDYSQPVLIQTTNNTTITNGQVSVSATAHGLSVGDRIYIVDSGLTQLDNADTTFYNIEAVPTADSFSFRATVNDAAATTCGFMKRQSVGLGFTHMPAPPWAVAFQYRLIMPFRYTMTGTLGSPTITDREIRDELIASDILDTDTYDQIYAQFRFSPGTADYLVGILGFADDKVVIFNRNSIHLVTLAGANADSASSQLLTSEVGLIARKSVQQIGDQIVFLSDNGVYGASFQDLYNLRGNSVPMSKPIEKTIARINKDYADKAVSAYFGNRYYLAVPLDDSVTNNAIIIFNFLNGQWESVDTVDSPTWEVTNLIVAGNGSARSLYAINGNGGVHELDARTDDKDRIITTVGGSQTEGVIQGEVHTRGYNLDSLERKKFNSMELHLESSDDNTSDLTISAEFENTDAEVSYGSLADYIGNALPISEDISLRMRMGNRRAYSGVVKLQTNQGRPKLRAVRVRGATSFRSQLRAE
jgi:hypothetical protein